MKIGLTGGIGCGKSTVLEIFRNLGWKVLQADSISKAILLTNGTVHDFLANEFGDRIFEFKEGKKSINTKILGEIVFSDKKSLTKLEEVLHPLVREKWQSLMLEDRNADWMMEIPLLYEKKLDVYFDKVICVVVHPQLQEQRLKKRGLSDKDIKARIDNQMNIEEKLKRAHLVISSSGSLPALNEQITEVQSLLL